MKEQNRLFLGEFELESRIISISDIHVNKRVILEERPPEKSCTILRMENMLTGTYTAYHIIDWKTDEVLKLLVIHKSYDGKEWTELSQDAFCMESISPILSCGIVVVDDIYRDDANYSYYTMHDDALFNPRVVIEDIEKMPYSKEIKEKLINLATSCIHKKTDIIGRNILSIIGTEPVWFGFKDYFNNTSLWSIDIEKKLYNSNTKTATIKGGIATMTSSNSIDSFKFVNKKGDIYALSIDI